MNQPSPNEITERLIAWSNGDNAELEALIPVVYQELRRLTECGDRNCFYPTWSPDGTQLAFYKSGVNTFIVDPDKQWAEQTPQPLPLQPDAAGHFELWSWSPNGQTLAGIWRGGESPGVFTYSLAARRYEQITEFGSDPVWLSDNRRLLFIHKFRLYLVDIRAKQPREILSLDPLRISLAAPARDNWQIYLSMISPEFRHPDALPGSAARLSRLASII